MQFLFTLLIAVLLQAQGTKANAGEIITFLIFYGFNSRKEIKVIFIWSIFIRVVIDHMTCYNLKWPKIKFWVHYFVFSCTLDHTLKRYIEEYILGWSKNPVSSETDKLMAGTKFSDYLGLKHYKKARKIKHFNHVDLAYWPQSFNTYHTISPTIN